MSQHLLIVGMKWPPETFLQRLVDGLLDAGWEITVATVNRPKAQLCLHWLPVTSSDTHLIRRLTHFAIQTIRSRLRASQDLQRLARHIVKRDWQTWNRILPFAGRRWDIVYFPWNSAAIDYLPLFDLKMPVVISCRGSQVNVAPHNPLRRNMAEGLQQTFACAAVVHCVSENIKQQSLQYGLDPDKAQVIHPAVDPDFFCPSYTVRQNTDTFRVIAVGSLVWVKGYEYALSAIRQLVDRGVPIQFEIVGDGPERQRVLYTIHDLDLEQHVFVRGRMTPEQVRDRLQQADAFLLSSLSEGISNAVLEAMACGVPVVTTDCGGMREAVSDSTEGFVVPVRDTGAMSKALHQLWIDPTLRSQMSENARARVESMFTINQQITSFTRLFHYVCADSPVYRGTNFYNQQL